MSVNNLITIDGPSASGKSSVSRRVATHLGWKWVSTGAFYRGLAFTVLREGASEAAESTLVEMVHSDLWKVEMTTSDTKVHYLGKEVTREVAGENVGAMASKISQIPEVRKALLQRQRKCFDDSVGLVAEGRDCGTVVFPLAPIKIYLTANPALRAQRRSAEEGTDQEKIQEMQIVRDTQDSQRKVAPLKEADGSLKIDSSFLSLEEVVQEVLKYSQSQGLKLP